MLNRYLKEIIPPFVARYISNQNRQYSGNYSTWQDAKKSSAGYDASLILEKTRKAMIEVKNGQAAYERDSVLFSEIEYSWPLLSGLLWVATLCKNQLSVLDYGGSLGSTYYQNRLFLDHLHTLKWSIVEQEHYVETGNSNFSDGRISFYKDIAGCIDKERPNAAIFSSVLQYLENPYNVIKKVTESKIDHVIIDRTLFIKNGPDRLTVQRVPKYIYDASYPVWLFYVDNILNAFTPQYEKVAEFNALNGQFYIDGTEVVDKGFIFRRRNI